MTPRYTGKEINQRLARRMPEVIDKLGLKGDLKRNEFIALNPTRNDATAGSFKINVTSGDWADFATSDKGDALALIAYLATKGDKKEAFKWALGFLGLRDEAKKSKKAAANGAAIVLEGLNFDAYAAAKKLDPSFLKSLGVVGRADARGEYVAFPYVTLDGVLVATQQRWALHGKNKFLWNKGAKTVLYAPDRMTLARELGYVIITEGASDVHTCLQHQFPAVGLPGAGNWNERRDAKYFDGVGKIYVVHEGDTGGSAVIDWLAKSSIRHRANVVYMAKPLKDPSALYLSSPESFRESLEQKLAAAVPWGTIEAERASEAEKTALEQCRVLAHDQNILDKFKQNLRYAGLVGEDRNASILYLALTSGLLRKPVSVAYKGTSAGGKSFTVDRVLAHFPDAAIVRITSMSEKALIYIEDDLAHKHLVIAEADGASGEFQEYLIRSLLSEGRLEHRMADKTAEGGITGRHIVKEGPTGLIITTTRVKLHPENETRLLSISANDTREQTRAVLRAVARRSDAEVDLTADWRALQTWLRHGERRVAIPYAETLAELASNSAVRMRRDFGQVLSLIEAHALLHRATRSRDDRGHIVATIGDYSAVRALVVDLIAEGVAATVSREVREAVHAVQALCGEHGVGLQAIATRLGVDKSAASRRCAAARGAGYIVNLEERRGREARYQVGEPMPEDAPVLPTADELQHEIEGVVGGISPAQHLNGATLRNPAQNDRCTVAVLKEGIRTPPPTTTDVLLAREGQWKAEI